MAYLVNKDFTEIAADGHNYLLWAINVKIILTTNGFIDDINKHNRQAHTPDTAKYNTLFLETSSSRISQDIGKGPSQDIGKGPT